MKKIINGKKYDTETAKEIARGGNDLGYRDFRYEDEYLYRKQTGEFFLAGEGGASSKYGVPCDGNAMCGGKDIIPLSLEEAKEWVEKHANGMYEELFGEVTE